MNKKLLTQCIDKSKWLRRDNRKTKSEEQFLRKRENSLKTSFKNKKTNDQYEGLR